MDQQYLFDPIPFDKLDILTREELVILLRGEQSLRVQMQKEVIRLTAIQEEIKQRTFMIADELVTVKGKLFGKSSERSARRPKDRSNAQGKKKILLPSQRYPNLPLIEKHVTLDKLPSCKCCGLEMSDSGMTEDSEYLTKVPAQYYVVVQMRHKYRCGKCHGDIQTAPAIPRIKEGSAYSDELMVDVVISKYCDLIPIDRQARMAGREGVKDLPPQSLIEASHYAADFMRTAYERLKDDILKSYFLHADETPHRMLEGDKKCHWYLWGFSNKQTSYFECHDTRSGDVASTLLAQSQCRYLESDVYTGYSKAVRLVNVERKAKGLALIEHLYCNAHARRYFVQAFERFPKEANFYNWQYQKIYRLEGLAKENPDKRKKIRERQLKYYIKMRDKCIADAGGYSEKSKLGKAMRYFLKNYEGFTRYLSSPDLPIDNNPQERLLRSPVIGRKTWYGTHSKRGAETAAILFSLVESCKLNTVNPREYFRNLVKDLHQGKTAYTPKEYKDLQK